MWQFIKNIIQLIFSPTNGWEDVASTTRGQRAFSCMMWTLVVIALSPLFGLVYHYHDTVSVMFQRAIIIYVSFVATYYIADFVLSLVIPRLNDGSVDTDRLKSFISYSIILLAIAVLVDSLLPISFAILELWPVYIVVIMWRAMQFLDIPEEKTGQYIAFVIAAIILPSQILIRLFNFVAL